MDPSTTAAALETILADARKLEHVVDGPAYGVARRLVENVEHLREILTRAACPKDPDPLRTNRDHEDRSADSDRTEERMRWADALTLASAAPDMPAMPWQAFCLGWAQAMKENDIAPALHPNTESQCLEMAQSIFRVGADFIDQAAALAPTPTHAMLYSAISSLFRGSLDDHLVRFINGAKPSDAERRMEELRRAASDLVKDGTHSDCHDFVRALAGGGKEHA